MRRLHAALVSELDRASATTRRAVVIGTAALTLIFAGFTMLILFWLAIGQVQFSAVAITLPVVALGAAWFGWIAMVAGRIPPQR
ncbi:MAG: hypothetical protein ABWZ77_06575 [Naasia sp.]